MSGRTTCNYCNLKRLREIQFKGRKVELKPEGKWLRVYVDGKKVRILFLAITNECVC